jgi:hypothetical protein
MLRQNKLERLLAAIFYPFLIFSSTLNITIERHLTVITLMVGSSRRVNVIDERTSLFLLALFYIFNNNTLFHSDAASK